MIAMLTACSVRRLGGKNVFLSFYDPNKEEYLTVDLGGHDPTRLSDCRYLAQLVGIGPSVFLYKQLKRKYAGRFVANVLHRTKLHYRRMRADRTFFAKLGIDLDSLAHASHYRSMDGFARAGDVILLMDAGWDVPELETALLRVKKRGATVVSLIHDIIPISHPQFVSKEATRRFEEWLIGTVNYSTLFLANSVNTGRALVTFLETRGVKIEVKPVPLAQEKLPSVASGNALRDMRLTQDALDASDAVQCLLSQKYVLFVGSRDIRKNLLRLAQAWDLLRAEHTNLPLLVIAGGKGGGNEQFDDFMEKTSYLDDKVRIVDHPSDELLDLLYRHCLFTVYPSLFEGWGLPVGESLSYGKCVVASNTSSIPEVAGPLGIYCDPTSVESIARAAMKLIADEPMRISLENTIRGTRLRSWQNVCDDLLKATAHPSASLSQ